MGGVGVINGEGTLYNFKLFDRFLTFIFRFVLPLLEAFIIRSSKSCYCGQ